MGVGLAVLMEVKIMYNHYSCFALGYKVLLSKVTSHNQMKIAPL